jgi:probable selenium-dependent hydroxylase accessory protein YqeC
MSVSLKLALGLKERELIALVGGGGKTTLMFSLARELASCGCRVITGPSTHIFMPREEDTPLVMLQEGRANFKVQVLDALLKLGHVTVGRALVNSANKVKGFETGFFSEIFQEEPVHYVIVEADGAKGRPLKAPREHEPVIPDKTTLVVGVMGLDGLGQPLGENVVFQVQRFSEITGLKPGETITERALFSLASHPEGLFKNAPRQASRVIFLNKCDRLKQGLEAEKVVGAFSLLSFPVRLAWGTLSPQVHVTVRNYMHGRGLSS